MIRDPRLEPPGGCEWHDYYDDGECPGCLASEDYATEQLIEQWKGN